MTREEFLNQLPILVGGYQPLPEIRARIASLDLVMIVGATGVGKTSIIKRLGVPFVITDTTRPIRPNEINGSDYNFRTDYDQLAKEIKERQFVQFNSFGGRIVELARQRQRFLIAGLRSGQVAGFTL